MNDKDLFKNKFYYNYCMDKENDYLIKNYFCRVCNEEHEIKLSKSLVKNREKFPFSYSFLHGQLKNILTTLYLDKLLEIRAVDVQELTDDDLFSKDQVISITDTLMKEVERLRIENERLNNQLAMLKKKKPNS